MPKIKTNRGAAKRFKKSASGRIKRGCADIESFGDLRICLPGFCQVFYQWQMFFRVKFGFSPPFFPLFRR